MFDKDNAVWKIKYKGAVCTCAFNDSCIYQSWGDRTTHYTPETCLQLGVAAEGLNLTTTPSSHASLPLTSCRKTNPPHVDMANSYRWSTHTRPSVGLHYSYNRQTKNSCIRVSLAANVRKLSHSCPWCSGYGYMSRFYSLRSWRTNWY